MKIVIAPDSFKESLTAIQVANAVEKGFLSVLPNAIISKIPMADGGEGTVQSLVDATNGKIVRMNVNGPLEDKVEAFFGLLGDGKTAVIEMAAASGLHLVPVEKRNPLYTTTIGTGELIKKVLDYGVNRIVIGIGGSATNDGGAGMAYALGVKFLDKQGNDFFPYAHKLNEIVTIDVSKLDERINDVKIEVACDVTNPLFGENGASAVYGPQKGATAPQVKILDSNLIHFSQIIYRQLNKDVSLIPGSGAAGGLGAGLIAFLNGKLTKGIELVIDVTKLEEQVKDADLVITGEGQINEQTPFGKTPVGVAQLAKKYKVPVIAIAGSYASGYDRVFDYGIDAVFSCLPKAMTLKEAFATAEENVVETSKNVARLYAL